MPVGQELPQLGTLTGPWEKSRSMNRQRVTLLYFPSGSVEAGWRQRERQWLKVEEWQVVRISKLAAVSREFLWGVLRVAMNNIPLPFLSLESMREELGMWELKHQLYKKLGWKMSVGPQKHQDG